MDSWNRDPLPALLGTWQRVRYVLITIGAIVALWLIGNLMDSWRGPDVDVSGPDDWDQW